MYPSAYLSHRWWLLCSQLYKNTYSLTDSPSPTVVGCWGPPFYSPCKTKFNLSFSLVIQTLELETHSHSHSQPQYKLTSTQIIRLATPNTSGAQRLSSSGPQGPATQGPPGIMVATRLDSVPAAVQHHHQQLRESERGLEGQGTPSGTGSPSSLFPNRIYVYIYMFL